MGGVSVGSSSSGSMDSPVSKLAASSRKPPCHAAGAALICLRASAPKAPAMQTCQHACHIRYGSVDMHMLYRLAKPWRCELQVLLVNIRRW